MNKTIPEKKIYCNREVKEEFTGKNLTRFGGTGLIRRYLKRIGISSYLEKIEVKKKRDRGYSPPEVFLSILYGILLGLSRPYHMMELVRDKVFQKIAGLKGFPTQSTISRFFKGLSMRISREIYHINYSLLMKVRKEFKDFTDGITADLDSHVTPVYGNQARAKVGFNPKKKGRKSYHPILCFIGETRDFLAGSLRSGKHHTSYNARIFLSSVIKALPVAIKRLRADSGFFSIEFIWWLKKKDIEFFIVVPLQQWAQRIILHQGSWESIGRCIWAKEILLPLGKTVSCRLVIIRTKVGKGEKPKKELSLIKGDDAIYDYQMIATNSTKAPIEVWRFYNKRANCENFIKESIYSFGLDNVVSQSWAGNNCWFQLVMLGYNIMNWFKEEVVLQRDKKTFGEGIRRMLLLIPGKLIYTARQYILKLEESWCYRKEYELALQRLE
ncbi:MAG: IS1380 family transposase [Nitrospirae bacterium]|nr:IS1380 family transposase [Nitrospirota bacterium]